MKFSSFQSVIHPGLWLSLGNVQDGNKKGAILRSLQVNALLKKLALLKFNESKIFLKPSIVFYWFIYMYCNKSCEIKNQRIKMLNKFISIHIYQFFSQYNQNL